MEVETTPAGDAATPDAARPTGQVMLSRTLNSLYKFKVTDPAGHFGLLTGGPLTGPPTQAICLTPALEVGSHARFLIGSLTHYRFMTTSNILEVSDER